MKRISAGNSAISCSSHKKCKLLEDLQDDCWLYRATKKRLQPFHGQAKNVFGGIHGLCVHQLPTLSQALKSLLLPAIVVIVEEYDEKAGPVFEPLVQRSVEMCMFLTPAFDRWSETDLSAKLLHPDQILLAAVRGQNTRMNLSALIVPGVLPANVVIFQQCLPDGSCFAGSGCIQQFFDQWSQRASLAFCPFEVKGTNSTLVVHTFEEELRPRVKVHLENEKRRMAFYGSYISRVDFGAPVTLVSTLDFSCWLRLKTNSDDYVRLVVLKTKVIFT